MEKEKIVRSAVKLATELVSKDKNVIYVGVKDKKLVINLRNGINKEYPTIFDGYEVETKIA